MSFTAITSGEIASGKPVSTVTQTKIKTNFDDHETRIETLESANTGDPPIIMRVGGLYVVASDVLKTTTNLALILTGVRLLIDIAGTSGTTAIDIQRKRGAGAFATIFTTPPSVSFSAGNDSISTNGIISGSMNDFIAGDILRLDITSIQAGGAKNFEVRIDFSRG